VSPRIELRRDVGRLGVADGPWIRRRQIARIVGAPDPHAVAQVVDRAGDTVGWGLVSAVSSITVRMLAFGPIAPADDWLQQRLAAAVAAREAYRFDEEGTTGYRLVNSEGDGLPGLVIDRYERDLVVQITTAPMAAREGAILDWLRARGEGALHVVLPDAAGKVEGIAPAVRRDHEVPHLTFHEHGLRFDVPAPPSQKTGAYFDQRANRRVVAHLARRHGGALLDVGCHVGGFALHARKLGVPVVALDQSELALELAARNAAHNGLTGGIEWIRGDMFGALDAVRGEFGTIVVDPPKIAARRSDLDRAIPALSRLAQRLAPRVADGGHLVLCSCSHHLVREHLDRVVATLPGADAGAWPRVQILGAGFDHPTMPCHREGEYLRVDVHQRRG
jgi:23S rRNA (cytosine1962-C5)-methyltransferase